METYPTLKINSLKDSLHKPLITSETENLNIKQRPRGTRSIRKFEISHIALSQSDKDTLQDFFETNNGLIFEFYNPKDTTTYNVIFDGMDNIDFTYSIEFQLYSTTIKMREQ
jgi:hypothetical protein